ncbi:ATP-binding cassette domain-containing protein, partial [bacterium]|nr:ATP-binding cassette domain-containing protein [bacterium]
QEELIDDLLGVSFNPNHKIVFAEDESWQNSHVPHSNPFAFIPQDRFGQALLPGSTVVENFMLNRQAMTPDKGWLPQKKEICARVNEQIGKYAIQTASPHAPIESLSGGHQQRVVIAREFMADPLFLLAHNPTRGLDIRAARFVHDKLINWACEKGSVLLFSAELSELFLLCQTIAVIYRGRIAAVRAKEEWSMEALGKAMAGAEGS